MDKIKWIVKAVFTTTALCLLLVVLTNCGDDAAAKSENDRIKDMLRSGTWKVQTVLVDDVDHTALYEDLTLAFTGTHYTTTNGANVWPASGEWNFNDDSGTTMLRSDGVIITIATITTTNLVLTFDWPDTTIGSGRAESIQGAHVFTFGK